MREKPYDLEPACLYLRKSRLDLEAEARGEGDTLDKHRKSLYKLAKEYGVNVTGIFPEVASGESIIHRPEMVRLLKEIDEGKWRSVFCVDIDRLGRGDMEDQGLILKTFKGGNTLIVTLRKIYDLRNEFDEEYTEFETFMARKEFKLINRRLQRGRVQSIEQGNYLGVRPPYGYQIEKKGKDRFLTPYPEQATIVQLIFRLYTQNLHMGANKIAQELNRLGYKTYSGKPWESSTVLFILKNEVYIGRVQWRKKEGKKSLTAGKKNVRTRPRSEWIDVQGKHEPLISKETFNQAQAILKSKYHVPYQITNGIANPLAGIIKCDMCGGSMVLRPYQKQPPHIICYNPQCTNKSSRFEYVERELINGLADWLGNYQAEWHKHRLPEQKDLTGINEKVLKNLVKEMRELEGQQDRLHDLLEKSIYDEATYLDRSTKLAKRLHDTATAITETEKIIATERKRVKALREIIPQAKKVLNLYERSNDPAAKNGLLKSVLEYATYRKEKWQKNDDFTLVLKHRVPK